MTRKLALFDYDGTLAKPGRKSMLSYYAGIWQVFSNRFFLHLLRDYELFKNIISSCAGTTDRNLVSNLLMSGTGNRLDEKLVDERLAIYYSYRILYFLNPDTIPNYLSQELRNAFPNLSSIKNEEDEIYPDTLPFLEQLRDEGWDLQIVTGNAELVMKERLPKEFAPFFCEGESNLRGYFGDKSLRRSSLIEWAIRYFQKKHELDRVCYFGDTLNDYYAALEARNRFLGTDRQKFQIVIRCSTETRPNIEPYINSFDYITDNFSDPELLRFLGIENHHPHPERRG